MSESCNKSSGRTTNKVRKMTEPGKRRLRQDLITISPHLKETGSYRNRARPLSEVHRGKTRDNRLTCNKGRSY